MPVDPRYFAPFDAGEIIERGQRMQMNKMRVEDYRSEQGRKKRLGDLLPGAARGDQASIDQLWAIDYDWADKLDQRQRAQAGEVVKDLAAATRWADNPEKWAQVQQHYAQKGVDLSPYGFEDRERSMLTLGKLGEYLETAPKRDLVVIDGVAIDKSTGQPQFESPYDRIIAGPNGSFYRVPRQGIGRGGQQPQSGSRPLTDEDIARMDGGQMGSAPSGGFPR